MTQPEDTGSGTKKKTSTSPLYTYGGGMTTSPQPSRSAVNYASPTSIYYGVPARQSSGVSMATGTGYANPAATGYYGNYGKNTPYGGSQTALDYYANFDTEPAQPAPLSWQQIMDLSQRTAAGREALLSTQADTAAAIRKSEQNAAAQMRQIGRGASTAGADWRSVLAGAGMGRSPLAALTLERLAAGAAQRQAEVGAGAEAEQQAQRDRLRRQKAATSRNEADIARLIAAYQTGNTDDILRALGV
jgi:hypothetical protein